MIGHRKYIFYTISNKYKICNTFYIMESLINPDVKHPVSVSLSESLIKWIDEEVKKGHYRNRSHFVEEALEHIRDKQVNLR